MSDTLQDVKPWRATLDGFSPKMRKQLREYRWLEDRVRCAVYFLISRGEVVYVGQATAGLGCRVATHWENGREFDAVWYLDPEWYYGLLRFIDNLETFFIRYCRPAYNGRGSAKTKATPAALTPELWREGIRTFKLPPPPPSRTIVEWIQRVQETRPDFDAAAFLRWFRSQPQDWTSWALAHGGIEAPLGGHPWRRWSAAGGGPWQRETDDVAPATP